MKSRLFLNKETFEIVKFTENPDEKLYRELSNMEQEYYKRLKKIENQKQIKDEK